MKAVKRKKSINGHTKSEITGKHFVEYCLLKYVANVYV